MIRGWPWLLVLVTATIVTPGCSKKTDATTIDGIGGTAAAKKQGKGKKKPKSRPTYARKTAVKGGSASKDKPPAKDAKKADEAAMKNKNKVDAAEPEACDDVPDMAGACGGLNLFFCMGKDLYAVDCEGIAKEHGFDGGACFETERQIDCLGCVAREDGTTACCDTQENYCCDDEGFCWDDAEGGDDK
jgi:hypothetical protein